MVSPLSSSTLSMKPDSACCCTRVILPLGADYTGATAKLTQKLRIQRRIEVKCVRDGLQRRARQFAFWPLELSGARRQDLQVERIDRRRVSRLRVAQPEVMEVQPSMLEP
jgi:hypothetical protein